MPNHKLDTDTQVFFYEQEFYVLSNFSAFQVVLATPSGRPVTYQTAEHAYQAQKFLPYPELYRAVCDARSAHDAARLAHIYEPMEVANWNEHRVSVMRLVIRAKYDQHEYVRRKLNQTGDRELVEDSWRDDFWGTGPLGGGQNILGKLWMELRRESAEEQHEPATPSSPVARPFSLELDVQEIGILAILLDDWLAQGFPANSGAAPERVAAVRERIQKVLS